MALALQSRARVCICVVSCEKRRAHVLTLKYVTACRCQASALAGVRKVAIEEEQPVYVHPRSYVHHVEPPPMDYDEV